MQTLALRPPPTSRVSLRLATLRPAIDEAVDRSGACPWRLPKPLRRDRGRQRQARPGCYTENRTRQGSGGDASRAVLVDALHAPLKRSRSSLQSCSCGSWHRRVNVLTKRMMNCAMPRTPCRLRIVLRLIGHQPRLAVDVIADQLTESFLGQSPTWKVRTLPPRSTSASTACLWL